MTAVCGMIGNWACAPDGGAHMTAMLRALCGREAGELATWVDLTSTCRLGVVDRCGNRQRPRVLEHRELAAVCDGRLFDRGDAASGDQRLLELWASGGPRAIGRADAQFALAGLNVVLSCGLVLIAVWDGYRVAEYWFGVT